MANEVTVEAILAGIERYRQIKGFLDQGVKELARALHEKVRRLLGQELYMALHSFYAEQLNQAN